MSQQKTSENPAREVHMTDEEWQQRLSPEEFAILRRAATEAPFTGEYVDLKDDGTFTCKGCGAELFKSGSKFDSGCGWPSFTEPSLAEAVELRADNSHFMVRTEVLCRKCGGHLGHVFDDGPAPLGTRYCINSASLNFDPEASEG